MCNCTCSTNNNSKRLECPVCRTVGQSIPFETVKSLVKHPTLSPSMKDTDFFICLALDCEVVYFSHDVVFRQEDVAVPVAFKTRASPKFVCYCNGITEEEISRAVVGGGAKTIGDIARVTGAMKNGTCLTNNPKGVCCHKDIETIIQREINRV